MRYKVIKDTATTNAIIPAGSTLALDAAGKCYDMVGSTKSGTYFAKDLVESTPEFFEPIQESRWTDGDMISFARLCIYGSSGSLAGTLAEFKKTRNIED